MGVPVSGRESRSGPANKDLGNDEPTGGWLRKAPGPRARTLSRRPSVGGLAARARRYGRCRGRRMGVPVSGCESRSGPANKDLGNDEPSGGWARRYGRYRGRGEADLTQGLNETAAHLPTRTSAASPRRGKAGIPARQVPGHHLQGGGPPVSTPARGRAATPQWARSPWCCV